jgi:two-component system LytT family response regulator
MLNCLIVDDEPIARQIVENYVSKLPYLRVEKTCKNAFEALAVLSEGKIDLMFLDINMPQLSGMSFLKTIKNPPKVIITTAYQEYALEGFELAVSDYLLKPFSLERFIQAVERVKSQLSDSNKNAEIQTNSEVEKSNPDFIFIKTDKRNVKVFVEEITHLEAYGNFVKVHRKEGEMMLASQTLTSFANSLPNSDFMKVHKSFLVGIRHIDYVEGNQIPIGKTHRKELMERVG